MRLADIRAALPVTSRTAYFNTGTSGPLGSHVVAAMREVAERELELGRSSPAGLPDFPPLQRETRARLAALIGADADELALTHSTTEGINVVLWGTRWSPGDEVLTSTVEHPGIRVPLHHLQQRAGVAVRVVEPAELPFAITDETRMVAVSHVSFSSGERLPVEAIVAAARQTGAFVLLDGAQSVGALPVDVHALGVDFYAFPGQKWLCGPDGTGGLYVQRALFDTLMPTFVGTRNLRPSGGPGRDPHNLTLAETAARYEPGSVSRAAIHGLHASLGWLADDVGLPDVYGRIAELTAYCHARLADAPGVEVITDRAQLAGLISFRAPHASVAALAEGGVTIRGVPENNGLRVSCGFFNTHEEIDRLLALLTKLD